MFVTPGLVKIHADIARCFTPFDRSMTHSCALEPPRPLVMRFGAMGDTVILLTLIRMLHQRFGTLVDVLSSGSWTRPLLEGQPGVGRLYLLHSGGAPYALNPQKQQLAAQLRRRGPSLTWACQYQPKGRDLLQRAGIPDTLVVDLSTTEPFRHEHIVDRFACFAKCSPVAFEEFYASRFAVNPVGELRSPPLCIAPAQRHATHQWLQQQGLADKPLILIQAGNKRTMRWWSLRQRASNTKYWPERHWARVLQALREQEPRAEILLLGVRSEWALNREIARLARISRVHNLAGQVPIPRLIGLQERAHGMVSVDTGPAHSAAALDCPLVVLFGHVDPALYAPRSPSQAVSVVRARLPRPSMQDIAPEQVIAAWEQCAPARRARLLQRQAQPPMARPAPTRVLPQSVPSSALASDWT
jgi:ADP-heptose:LPS heptosyltransferase